MTSFDSVGLDNSITVAVGPPGRPVHDDAQTGRTDRSAVAYWRRTEGLLDVADDLAAFDPAEPDRAWYAGAADVALLVAMALGVRCPPWRTHVRDVGRIPPAATGWFSSEGVVIRADTSHVDNLASRPMHVSTDRLTETAAVAAHLADLIRGLPDWHAPGGAMVAHGGGAGSALLLKHRPPAAEGGPITVTGWSGEVVVPGRGRWPVEELAAELPKLWPLLWRRHLPAALSVVAAAHAGVGVVITGHDLRRLLSASPAELAMMKPGRWSGEPTFSGRRRHPAYRHAVGDGAGPPLTEPGPWGWLTPEGADQVGALREASDIAWFRWAAHAGQACRDLLAVWADPGLAWTMETARRLGVQVTIPAWRPDILAAVWDLPLSLRATVEHGLIRNGPLLGSPESRERAVGGEQRCRTTAAAWAASPAGAVALDRLTKGYLVDAKMVDGTMIRNAIENSFIRTNHALTLHRLTVVDSWLGGR
ncbi:hypothetical protein [Nocardia transvalensis]|uniref:hypothetical protein n=1 Tax=Nocardia transvalensis TaxID=37333 RepID=UPI001895228E|nr:hypothetical protein [Nocardia transvalensis]MBF6331074.1 hypothetical protein [Nocardia transvalensis]